MATRFGDPAFIIKCDNAYYVTQFVAAYDMAKANSDTEREDIQGVIDSFNEIKRNAAVCEAVKVPKSLNLLSRQATNRR